MRALRRIPDLREEALLKAWLCRIARNTCLDYLRDVWMIERALLTWRRQQGGSVDVERAKLAKAEARIDPEFFDRYVRVVRVLRVLTLKDPEGILLPLFEKEISSFVASVLGPQATGATKTPMPEIARALKVELDSLNAEAGSAQVEVVRSRRGLSVPAASPAGADGLFSTFDSS